MGMALTYVVLSSDDKENNGYRGEDNRNLNENKDNPDWL
jgi:hypothetical protein